ncbi:hypothetical protein L0F63_002387 [Massospora cicadina]|nr:hypothetical protein L0F63_002387 [Massospora cicadina]
MAFDSSSHSVGYASSHASAITRSCFHLVQIPTERLYTDRLAAALYATKASASKVATPNPKPTSPLAHPPLTVRNIPGFNKRKPCHALDSEEERYHALRAQELRPLFRSSKYVCFLVWLNGGVCPG